MEIFKDQFKSDLKRNQGQSTLLQLLFYMLNKLQWNSFGTAMCLPDGSEQSVRTSATCVRACVLAVRAALSVWIGR
jgi:hypothetical protein